MARTLTKTRKDSHGYALRPGEYQRSEGRYEFKYKGMDGKMHSIYAKKLTDLRKEENRIRYEIDQGLDASKGQLLTLNEMYDMYMHAKRGIKVSTRRNYIYTYNKFVRDGFGKKRIGRITFMDVQNFYNAMLEQDRMLATTLESIHTQIHPALQYAVRLRYIPTNPSSGAMTDIKKSDEWDGKVRKRHALTMDQQMAFTDCYTNHKDLSGWANIMTFLLGTGCRIGEALGMTWQDIDFENSLIHVNKALLYRPDEQGKSVYTISSTKTKNGVRSIPMIDEVRDALLDEREIQLAFGNYKTQTVDGVTGFVFTQAKGTVYNPEAINRAIDRIITAHNEEEEISARRERREPVILPHFSAHHLRHTFCTRLCMTDLSIKEIQDIMGHADINTTMNIYAEVHPDMKKKSLTKMAGKIIINRNDMSINEAIAYDDEDDVE